MKRAEPAVRDLFRYRDGIGRGVHVTQQGQVTHREPGADQPLPLDRPGVRRRHRHAEEEFRVGGGEPQRPEAAVVGRPEPGVRRGEVQPRGEESGVT